MIQYLALSSFAFLSCPLHISISHLFSLFPLPCLCCRHALDRCTAVLEHSVPACLISASPAVLLFWVYGVSEHCRRFRASSTRSTAEEDIMAFPVLSRHPRSSSQLCRVSFFLLTVTHSDQLSYITNRCAVEQVHSNKSHHGSRPVWTSGAHACTMYDVAPARTRTRVRECACVYAAACVQTNGRVCVCACECVRACVRVRAPVCVCVRHGFSTIL